MPEAPLFRLCEFAEQLWEPSLDSVKAAQSSHVTLQASLQLFESLFWLQLGVELDSYPSTEANALLYQERPLLMKLLTDHESFLENSIPPRLFYSLKETLGTRNMGLLDSFQNSTDLVPYLEAGFALAANMNASCLISLFHRVLSISEVKSQQFLTDAISNGLVAELFLNDAGTYMESAEAAAAGFLKTVEKMLRWNQLFASLQTDSTMNPGDRAGLSRRIGQITYWRLDLNSPSIKNRFERAAIAYSGFTVSVMDEARLGSTLEKPELFIEAIRQIQQDWHKNHPFHLYFEQGG